MRRPYAAMKENTEQLSSEEKQYRKMTEEPVCRLIMKLIMAQLSRQKFDVFIMN